MKFLRPLISITLFVSISFISFTYFAHFFHGFDSPNNFLYFLNAGNRLGHLYDAVQAHQDYNIDLIRYLDFIDSNGEENRVVVPMETAGDDLGMYYFIPKLIDYFPQVTYVDAYLLFFIAAIILGFALASVGFHLLLQSNRWFAVSNFFYALLAFFCYYSLDVYCMAFFACSTIPLLLHFLVRKFTLLSILGIIMLAMTFGICNYFRAQAGTGALVFLVVFALFFGPLHIGKRAIYILLLCIGFISWPFISKQIMAKRNHELAEQGFDKRLFSGFNESHLFWHAMFLGLGYFPDNDYGIVYQDQYAYMIAKEYARDHPEEKLPNFTPLNMPKEYEEIMKKTYLAILKENPPFVLKTYFFKFLHSMGWVLIFLHIGIVILWIKRPHRALIFASIASVFFYILPGILVKPHVMYMLGACSIATLVTILTPVRFSNH